jgi:hypothetical protein
VGRILVDPRVPDRVEVQVAQFAGCIEYSGATQVGKFGGQPSRNGQYQIIHQRSTQPMLVAALPMQDPAAAAAELERAPELFGMFSRSHVFPIGRFADGIAHTLRRCGADIPESDLANIADVLLRVALGIIVFPTDRLDTSDPAAVRDYAARYLVPIIGQTGP